MSAKPSKSPSRSTAASRSGGNKASKVKVSGQNTRVRAHLKSSTKRNQAKRDSK